MSAALFVSMIIFPEQIGEKEEFQNKKQDEKFYQEYRPQVFSYTIHEGVPESFHIK
jgi:hypothetical protein